MDDNRQKLNDALDKVVNERPLAKDPFPRAKEESPLREQTSELQEKEAAVAAQREVHNARVAGE